MNQAEPEGRKAVLADAKGASMPPVCDPPVASCPWMQMPGGARSLVFFEDVGPALIKDEKIRTSSRVSRRWGKLFASYVRLYLRPLRDSGLWASHRIE
jgi:hypothetical protein